MWERYMPVFWLRECVEWLRNWLVKNKVRLEVVEDVLIKFLSWNKCVIKWKKWRRNCNLILFICKLAYDRINREALWQMLMIYGISLRLLNGIKSVYIDNEACLRINEVGSEWFKNESCVRRVVLLCLYIILI